MFSKLGESVAVEMERILCSDAHVNLFKKADVNSEPQIKTAAKKCDCEKNCSCKQDGECKDACPCDKAKCECKKDCDKCKCDEKTKKCVCLDDKKKSDALQDLSYVFSKISKELDDAGYVKSSIAVMRAHTGLLVEAQGLSPEEEYALRDEFGYDPEDAPLEEKMTQESQLLMPEEDQPADVQLDLTDMGADVISEQIDKIKALLDAGKYDQADELMDALSTLWEEDDDIPPPPPVEELTEMELDLEGLTEMELDEYEAPAGPENPGAPEGLGATELENVHSELDAWLKKNAGAGVIHRYDNPTNPELSLDLDVKDLLTAEDGVETNLIDAYLSELDSSFEDE